LFLPFIILIKRYLLFWLKGTSNYQSSYAEQNHIVKNRFLFRFLKEMLSREIGCLQKNKKILLGSIILLAAHKPK